MSLRSIASKIQLACVIARFEVQMETGDEFKISWFTKFGVVSLDFNHVEGFQKSEKLETLYGLI